MPKKLPELMTIKMIREETGLPERTIRSIVGHLVKVETGTRTLVFKRSDVERVLAKRAN